MSAKMTRLEAAKKLLAKKPNVSPTKAAEALQKRGYKDATPGYVSSLKTQIKADKANKASKARDKAGKPQVTKTETIREYFRQNPDAKPPIVAEEFGIHPTHCYKLRREVRDAAGIAPRAGRPGPRAKKAPDKVSLSAIKSAKSLIDAFGGVDEAIKAVDAISDMGGASRAKATLEAIAIFTS